MAFFLKIHLLLISIWVAPFPGLCHGAEAVRPQQAEKIKVEDLGILVESATLDRRLQFYLPRTRQTHLLLCYVTPPPGRRPFQILDLNLNTGKSRVAEGTPGRPGPHGILLHSNGLVYIGSGDPGFLMVYDPATGQSRQLEKLADKGAQVVAEGDDGAVYLGECVKGCVERYEPATGAWENYGIMDDPGPPYYRYAYTLGADGRYVYAAMGQNPWYLVVYDRVGKSQRVFWKDQRLRSVTVFRGRGGGWFASSRTQEGKGRWYRLAGGLPHLLKTKPVAASSPGRRGPASPSNSPFDLDLTRATPDSGTGGTATVRWRRGKTGRWRQASAKLRLGPMDLKRLHVSPDSALFGFTSFYGPVFRYEPGTGVLVLLGRPRRSLYDALFDEGQWFLAGYPAAVMSYCPARPWDLWESTQDLYDPRRNPHLLRVSPQGAAKYQFYLARGADGFIYFGGHHERSGVGGSLGWFNPRTGVTGGLREPFLQDDVSDLIAVKAGSQIIFSSHGVGRAREGKLFIFDPQQKKLLGSLVPLPGSRDAGKLVEVAPGVVLGVVAGRPRSRVYRVDLNQRKLQWQRELEGTAFGRVRGYDRRLAKGPDGGVWLYSDDTICRIDPADGSCRKIVAAPPAGNLLFFHRDLYIYGGPSLRKVTGLFKEGAAKGED